MSAVALDVTTSRPSSTRLHAVPSEAPAEKASAAASQPDIAVVSAALAVLTILGMFTAFAAVADSKPVVVGCAIVSVVVSVATAFQQLRRAGV